MMFLNTVYQVLTRPSHTFQALAQREHQKGQLLVWSIIIVLLISGIGAIYSPMVFSTKGLALKMVLSAYVGFMFWFFSGGIFAVTAYVFGIKGRPHTVLSLTAFATLPWIFTPVLMLFKNTLGTFGQIIVPFGCMGLWLWSAVLFLMAIKFTYNLSLDRVLLAACLPLLMTFLGLSWIGGFFYNIIHFLS